MGDANGTMTGFQARASALLTKTTFSDLEIQVIDGNTSTTFPAHKLFLAMSSNTFADIFYGNRTDSPRTLKIFNYKPHIVYLMLEYIYTDKTDVSDIENVKELMRLAKQYQISDLEKFCISNFFEVPVTLDNLFERYEFALSEDVSKILKVCRNFVSTRTREVLNSLHFMQASELVVCDIMSQNTLTVRNEMDLINSAMKWAKHKSIGSEENLRSCLFPLFQHLRFLTLTATEFCDFVEQYVDVLNARESSIITRLLLQPMCNAQLPPGFNTSTCPRQLPDLMLTEHNATGGKDPVQKFEHTPEKTLSDHMDELMKMTSKTLSTTDLRKEKYLFGLPIKTGGNTYKINSSKFTTAAASRNSEVNWQNNKFRMTKTENNYSLEYKNGKLQEVKKTGVSPFFAVTQSSIPVGQRQHFELHLVSIQKCPKSSFPYDIICQMNINLKRGNIEIYGVELKILSENTSETVKAVLTVNEKDIIQEYNENPRNDIYLLSFPKPWKLLAGQNVKIEVFLEELVLNRCLGIDCSEQYEFNSGLGINAEMTLNSNHPDESCSGIFYYSISRLLYRPM